MQTEQKKLIQLQKKLINYSKRALDLMYEVLNDETIGSKERVAVAKDLLDRVGLDFTKKLNQGVISDTAGWLNPFEGLTTEDLIKLAQFEENETQRIMEKRKSIK